MINFKNIFLNFFNIGVDTLELTILPEFFLQKPEIKKWRVDFEAYTSSFYGGTAIGVSSIILGINQLPYDGTCEISPESGVTGNTTFSISCFNWTDSDGFISRIEYYCNAYILSFFLN